jgi:ribonucleoside-diphosphate reductase alpha chain
MYITKRDNARQELDLNKIHAVLTWACEGQNDDALTQIKGVSVSEIEMRAQLHFFEGMKTKAIHETLIKAASELISEDTPNYDHVAARLVWFSVRKEAFRDNVAPHLKDIIKNNIERGVYTHDIINLYSEAEINEINSFIEHKRDDLFRYAGAEQMRKKYLVQNRKTKALYESFQIPYILVAALLFSQYPKNTRLKYVKKYYDLISQHYISLPTPIMAGLRTKVKQFSSCTLIESGDSLKSINGAAGAIVDYASRKAGIGLSIGSIRAEGQTVRNGDAVTTGVVPFAKYFNAALKSCSQGAVRGASATFNYPVWHLEFERLIELKNNKGTDETRLRTVDYCVHLNKLFYERLSSKGIITFFSPEEVPDLYASFYSSNYKEFEKLYKHYEKDETKTKKTLPAIEVFTKIMQERFETGRIYIMNADHMNSHGPFYESIKMTNLCTEIGLPTMPMGNDESLIALCTLSAINWGKFIPFGNLDVESSISAKQDQKLRDACEMAVRGLDALLDYQEYPLEAAKRHSMRYRPLGIGIIGFAHWLAKGRLYWGESNTLQEVEFMMEKMAYYLTESSINLAKEFGSIPVKTKYHDGIFPIDTSVLTAKTQMDWDLLKNKAKKYGIRNATLMALMPSETSSQLSNETNGIEPPRDMVSIKGSKEGVLPQIVPDFNKLASNYQTLWQVKTRDYLKTIAILQKYIDQAISINTSYDPSKFEDGIKMSQLIEDLLYSYKLGHKTLYYCNTRDGSGDETDDGCDSGACKI